MNAISNRIEMPAPPQEVFEVVSDLACWPRYLPHYRWIRVIENHPDHQLVRMACFRGLIPINWVSRYHADASKRELHFLHQKAFTRGMHVVWHLEPARDGTATAVTITHEMDAVRSRLGRFIADRVIGGFFIDHVATRTLGNFSRHFAGRNGAEKP